ncbi:MAG: undecaprenyl-diphosphate phosphatase [Actinomycetota bacterium]|nr:undecaprenyl-diphosphate phosphatase [Actinomycetota bacterium]
MSWLQAVVLGVVQGLTEFLPISSTAHLRIVPALLGWDDPGAAFTAVTQLGTMAAVVAHFAPDLIRITRAWVAGLRDPAVRRTLDARLGWYIGLGTIPIAVAGVTFRNAIETGARNLVLIALALIAGGAVLWVAERRGRRSRSLESFRAGDGLFMGLAQAAALVPGVSRSGATISAGLFLGLDRVAAARYSFLLSVPAVVLSGLFELGDIAGPGGASLVATAVASVFAFGVGYASISFLLRLLVTSSTVGFVVYRVVLGALVLALLPTGVL